VVGGDATEGHGAQYELFALFQAQLDISVGSVPLSLSAAFPEVSSFLSDI